MNVRIPHVHWVDHDTEDFRKYVIDSLAVTVLALVLVCMLAFPTVGALAAEIPKRGGILSFVVASYPPGFDGHPHECHFGHGLLVAANRTVAQTERFFK